jgi:hypothetical protein
VHLLCQSARVQPVRGASCGVPVTVAAVSLGAIGRVCHGRAGAGRGPPKEAADQLRWRLPPRIAKARAASAAIAQRYGVAPTTAVFNDMLEACVAVGEQVQFPAGSHLALSIFREMQVRRWAPRRGCIW